MIDFSSISQNSVVGKILRFLLKFIPANSRLFILQGKLRGKKWIKGSGVNSYWLGNYELDKQKLFLKIVKQGDVVFDIGAHVGFYTLLASELVGQKGKVFAFEPLPRNIEYLKKHIKINICKNVNIIKAAVSDKGGNAFLNNDSDSFSSRIVEDGKIKIRTVTIDDLVSSGKLQIPNVIKMDVEGAELSVLEGTASILKKNKPVILLSTHGGKIHKECRDFLKKLGYNLKPIAGDKFEKANEIFAQ